MGGGRAGHTNQCGVFLDEDAEFLNISENINPNMCSRLSKN